MPLVRLTAIVPKTFSDLCRGVKETFVFGQRRADEIKVQTYWETGRLIDEHVFFHRKRAKYGDRVVPRLARFLKADRRSLYECLQFYRAFPNVSGRSLLSWSHYRRLMQVADPAERTRFTLQATKEGWTGDETAARVATFNGAKSKDTSPEKSDEKVASTARSRPLIGRRGTPGRYRVVADGDSLAVDLGFKFYRRLPAGSKLKADDIVHIEDGRVALADGAIKADLFTYRATVRRVIDGDTLVVAIDVASDIFHTEKLRLRGLDCPELSTVAGKAAKRFADALVRPGCEITISTTKPDKYDRYLADVFVPAESGDLVFLNNALLENGHAVRKDEWEFHDWGI